MREDAAYFKEQFGQEKEQLVDKLADKVADEVCRLETVASEEEDRQHTMVKSPVKDGPALELFFLRRLKEDGIDVRYSSDLKYMLLYDHEVTDVKVKQEEENRRRSQPVKLAPRHIFAPKKYISELKAQKECASKKAHWDPQTREQIKDRYAQLVR